MVDEPKSAQEVWKDPVNSTHVKKTGGLKPGRFKPIEEPGAEEKDPVVFTGLETVRIPLGLGLLVVSLNLLLSYRILSWLVLLRRFYLTKKSMSDDLATISSRISSLEAGHRVSLSLEDTKESSASDSLGEPTSVNVTDLV
jgi:hypothetical protein